MEPAIFRIALHLLIATSVPQWWTDDKMTDCDVEEPAGASGCCLALVPNVLTLVNVDTASGNRDSGGHELSIKGLIASEEFKRDVWQMKRGALGGQRGGPGRRPA